MPDIFSYSDYRKFLADYYEERKTSRFAFSYENFSRMAGFASKSFVFNVINGRKNLARGSIVSLCEAMELGKTEAACFETLVHFNQATNFKERNFYYEKLSAIRPNSPEAVTARKLRNDQYEFYSNWYHAVIRSLIDLYPDIGDPDRLAAMVRPPLKRMQVKKSIELLSRLGLIERRKDGGYAICDKILTTGPEVESLAVQRFHLACMELAANALRELPKNERNVSGLTLGISKAAYEEICKVIQGAQETILDIAGKDRGSDTVYQLNFHLFPVSRTGNGQGKS
jgi:uncharacterized protein (TIGR02147 family)